MKRLHLICNAHIDAIWQWTWDEGISSALSTFKSAADLAEEFDYIFCHGESLLYETIEKNEPRLFARIQKLVKQGKWKITGGWYLQPDCLMPNGETFVRQISVGKKYFMEKFGVEPTVATNYDSFGHSVGLVQILAKNGYIGYMHCRPYGNQFEYPSKFYNWIGPDGSKVLATQTNSYNSLLGKAVEKIKKEAGGDNVGMLGVEGSKKTDQQLDVDYVLWGVGNHGGGPSRKDLYDIYHLNIENVEIFHSTPDQLLSDNITNVKDITKSLVTCMPGCYSSMARIKQAYRKTETLFYGIEKMISAAMLAGYVPNLKPLEEAEKRLLLASFHDILPGSCIEEGEREGLGLLSSCEKTLKDYRTDAFLYLAMNQPCASEGEFPIFVFNYFPQELTTQIETEFMLADQNWERNIRYIPHVYDENGNELTSQLIKEQSTLNLDWRKKIIFEGKLKPLGVTRFTVKVAPVSTQKREATIVNDLEQVFKNNKLLSSPAILELYDDTADPWGMSAEELKSMGKNPQEFRLMTEQEAGDFCAVKGGMAPIRRIERGKVYTGIECFYTAGRTNAALQYKLYKNSPYMDIQLTVEFMDKNKLLRLKVPIPKFFQNGKVVGDGPYVWEEKGDCEITFQKWLGAQKKNGEIFAVANDGTYAGKAENGYLHFTLLRGSGYCFHPIRTRKLYPEDRYLPRIDCGRYVYNFRVFKGNIYNVTLMSEIFNLSPYAVNVFPTGKINNDKVSLSNNIKIDGSVLISAIIPRDDDRFVIRIYNPSSKKEEFTLYVGEKFIQSEAMPYAVVSYIYHQGIFKGFKDTMPT